MLYRTCKRMIERGNLEGMSTKLDVFYAASKLTDDEYKELTELLAAGFTDTFRYLHPDERDAYSWWSFRAAARSRNVGWRIDYFLVSDRLRPNLDRAFIRPEIEGSDHCPVGLDLHW